MGILIFGGLWWIGSILTQPGYLIPSPVATMQAFVELSTSVSTVQSPVFGTVTLPTNVAHLFQTFHHYVPGLLLGTAAGVVLGIAMAWHHTLDDWLTPIVRVLRPIPPLAWVVFAIVWFGIGHGGALFIVFVGGFWINFYGAYGAVEDVSNTTIEAAAVLGVEDDRTMLYSVVLPSALPQLLTAFRTSIGRCLMIVVGAELFGAPGVGSEIMTASNYFAMDIALAYMLLISIAFLTMDVGFRIVERLVLTWR